MPVFLFQFGYESLIEIAEQFCRRLCGRSWHEDDYACSVEPWRPLESVLPVVRVGELPDFSRW